MRNAHSAQRVIMVSLRSCRKPSVVVERTEGILIFKYSDSCLSVMNKSSVLVCGGQTRRLCVCRETDREKLSSVSKINGCLWAVCVMLGCLSTQTFAAFHTTQYICISLTVFFLYYFASLQN